MVTLSGFLYLAAFQTVSQIISICEKYMVIYYTAYNRSHKQWNCREERTMSMDDTVTKTVW